MLLPGATRYVQWEPVIIYPEKGMRMSTEKLFTVYEAADVTRLSVAWWRQAVFQRKVRYLKLGRRVLIPESTIHCLLESSAVNPRAQSTM